MSDTPFYTGYREFHRACILDQACERALTLRGGSPQSSLSVPRVRRHRTSHSRLRMEVCDRSDMCAELKEEPSKAPPVPADMRGCESYSRVCLATSMDGSTLNEWRPILKSMFVYCGRFGLF